MIDGPRQLVIYRVNHGIPRFTLSSFFLISFFPPQSLNGLLATIYIEQSRPRLNLLPRFDLSFLLFLYFILPTNEIANSHRILTSSSTTFLSFSLSQRYIFHSSLSCSLFVSFPSLCRIRNTSRVLSISSSRNRKGNRKGKWRG